MTVRNFENEKSSPIRATVDAMRAAFERAGVDFIAENDGGPGVKLKKRMTAPTGVHIVQGGDHSLLVSKAELKARGVTQEDVDLDSLGAVEAFIMKT